LLYLQLRKPRERPYDVNERIRLIDLIFYLTNQQVVRTAAYNLYIQHSVKSHIKDHTVVSPD